MIYEDDDLVQMYQYGGVEILFYREAFGFQMLQHLRKESNITD